MKLGLACRLVAGCVVAVLCTVFIVRWAAGSAGAPLSSPSLPLVAIDANGVALSFTQPMEFGLRYSDKNNAYFAEPLRITYAALPDQTVSQLRSRIFQERIFRLPPGTYQTDLALYRLAKDGTRELMSPPAYLRDALRPDEDVELVIQPSDPGDISDLPPKKIPCTTSTADVLRTTGVRWGQTLTSNLTKPPVPNRSAALCLSGMNRLFPFTYAEIYRSLVVPNNADVFIFATVFSENDVAEATKLFTALPWVRAFRLENHRGSQYQQFRDMFCPPLSNQPRTASMFRKVYMCEQLVSEYEQEHGFKYKILIRSRPDFLNDMPNRYEALRTCPPNRVCLHHVGIAPSPEAYADHFGARPDCSDPAVSSSTAGCPGCCPYATDAFAYGDREIMHRYSQMYLHLNRYQYHGRGSDLPEHFAYQALESLNLTSSLLDMFLNTPTLYRISHHQLLAHHYQVADYADMDESGRQIDI